jgi:hypothetical protein
VLLSLALHGLSPLWSILLLLAEVVVDTDLGVAEALAVY